jgi:hypothetical protein
MSALPHGYGPGAEDDERLRPPRRDEGEDVNPYDAEDEAERARQARQRRAGELSAVLLDITRPQPIVWLLEGAIDLTADARRMHGGWGSEQPEDYMLAFYPRRPDAGAPDAADGG